MAKVLITGSTGFIGKRLMKELLEEGHTVYALIRRPVDSFAKIENLELIQGEVGPNMADLPEEIDAAFYLIHSLHLDKGNLLEEETAQARAFVEKLEKTKAKQILYLTGIIEDEEALSDHLLSRLAVEKELQKSKIPCTTFRASIIIGSGSASFEIIRDLVEKIPIMITPKWVRNFCQPIGIEDVIFYLSKALLDPECFGKVFDIGGERAYQFEEVLLEYAKHRNLKRFIFRVPVLTPKLSSYWLVFVSSVKLSICRYLIESMKHSTRKLSDEIDKVIPHKCQSLQEAFSRAFEKIESNQITSSWKDAWSRGGQVSLLLSVPKEGCFIDEQKISLAAPREKVIDKIWTIGGKSGWYTMNWAWKIRGFFDRLIGGVGLRRGRRDFSDLQVGDALDFWRVLLANKNEGRLILYAEMKLPGEAWLEFKIRDQTLIQTATFRPKGLGGRLYWTLLYPFHVFIFRNLAKKLSRG